MIEISNLSVTFSENIRAIDHVCLLVPDKKTTVVVGESGSGKSVMLAAILHILPSSAKVSGSVKLDGEELLIKTEKQMEQIRGCALSYIPQGGGTSMNPLLTVGYQVAEPLIEKKHLSKKEALRLAVSWMKKLNLENEEKLAVSYPHTLSGGMRQRTLIAMGAITGAPVLLADEPTKGLDGERIETVIELFRTLKDRTILCVSHDLNVVRAIADYVCVMYAAQQVEICTARKFFEEPLHPYSKMILAAMPENGLKAVLGFAPAHTKQGQTGCHFYSRCPYRMEHCCKEPPVVEMKNRRVRCWLYADSD
ncbi:MAG: ABC transporter ATP-binding protein [Lachnospiraceae bacterium]